MNEIVEAKGSVKLTDRQNRLVEAVAIGLDNESAFLTEQELADKAGYGNALELHAALRSEAVQAELKAIRASRIKATLAQKALKAMENLITSDKTPAATRYTAAKWVLEQAGHKDAQADLQDKPLNEMSEAELGAFIARSQKVIDDGGDRPTITIKP